MILFRALAAFVLLMAEVAMADPGAVRDQYPEGSIDSVEKADQALLATQAAHSQSETDYTAAQIACGHKFLVNACLTKQKKAHLAQQARINAVEIEAKRFKRVSEGAKAAGDRKDKTDKRDTNAQQDAAERAQNRSDYESKQTDATHKEEQKASDTAQAPSRAEAYQQKVKEAQQKQADDAATRKTRAAQAPAARADQAQKEEDAQVRQERLARKHADKQIEREHKAAEQADKNANLPPAPPPQVVVPGESGAVPLPK